VRYQRAAEAGARWNRWALYWSDVERSPGVYDWSATDQTLAADEEYGFKTNAILLNTPGFHNGMLSAAEAMPRVDDKAPAFAVMRGEPIRRAQAGPGVPPRSLYQPTFADGTDTLATGKAINPNNTWARFVAAAVARYGDRVDAWEIWNEPDFNFFWQGSVADYARLLKVAWLTARSVDPDARVLLGGMMYWEWANRSGEHAWLRAFLDELARDPAAAGNDYYFDAIPWHFYSRSSDAYDKLRSAESLLTSRGIRGKQHWLNETNVPACGEPPRADISCAQAGPGTASIDEQAAYVIQAFAYALAANAAHVSHFQLQDDRNVDGSFGLFRNDGSARPAYAAYRVVAQYFGGATAAAREGNANVERISITTPRGRVTAVWSRVPRDEVARVPATSGSATLVEQDGTTTTIVAQGGEYVVPVARATNNKSHSGDPNDYPIGGRPRLIVEVVESRPVPSPPAGWRRQYGPLLPQRGPAA
jgi:hypothetical protein